LLRGSPDGAGMSNRTISVAGLLAICLLGLAAQTVPIEVSGDPAHAPNDLDPPEIILRNLTPYDQPAEIVEWSVARYELAGLQLPDVQVSFYSWDPSLKDCAGHGGLWTFDQDRHSIDVCAVGVPSRRRMLLHEFAHAWTHVNLTDGDREAFLGLRGLGDWNDRSTAWENRGAEQAAEIVGWGLYMYCDPQHMVKGEDAASLTAAFELLTGTQPICEEKPVLSVADAR
jgi:hypothetical protein